MNLKIAFAMKQCKRMNRWKFVLMATYKNKGRVKSIIEGMNEQIEGWMDILKDEWTD